ncbi:hypothetical protein RHMOL_Rhmol10G0175000 [Rhododendron molle]|uniref:Uncharacterized protein n=1 Tax=Rhododendron molle TaxID=49168 RepID=A0ACC0M3J5_RHOML|nr:hypothetical protein RHMOL_Rhmol10G0175000 [Rhododendron molle]
MAEHGNSGSEGEVVDRVEDQGGPMETQTCDRMAVEEAVGVSAVVASGGDGEPYQQQEIGDEEKDHATEVNPHATVLTGAVGSVLEVGGSGLLVE